MLNVNERDPLDMSGRSVIVTGGTKGLGRAIATRFLDRGADVVVCARNRPDDAVEAEDRSSPRFNAKVLALNLLAPLTFAQAVHPVMTAQRDGGVIVNISSVSGLRPNPMGAAYGAAKAGLVKVSGAQEPPSDRR